MSFKFDGTAPETIRYIDKGVITFLDKLIYNDVTAWENWILKTGTHTTQTFTFALGTGETKTGTTFSPVKPTKLYLNYKLICREWVVYHNVRIEGLTESGTWITLYEYGKELDGDSSSNYELAYDGTVTVNASQTIKQLRCSISGRYWENTVTVKITEWYQKGA